MKKMISFRTFVILTIIFSLFSNVGFAEKDYVSKQNGIPGCENIDTAQLKANLDSLKGTAAEDLGDALNRPLIILRQFCPDGTSTTDFIHMILSHYGYWDDFMEYVALLVKIQSSIPLTGPEMTRFIHLSNSLSGISPTSESGTDLFTTLNKYDGQAGQLGGFCNIDTYVGTCLYDSRPYLNAYGNYQYAYDSGNPPQPTTLIPRSNGQSTYNFCKNILCDPELNVNCVNGCGAGLACCSELAGPAMERYFQPTDETETQMTLVRENFPSGSTIGTLSSLGAEASQNSLPILGSCTVEGLPEGYFSGCLDNPIGIGETSCINYFCPGYSYKQMYIHGNPGGCTNGACWVYGTPIVEGGSTEPSGTSTVSTPTDGGACPVNGDGTVTHTCSGGDTTCYDTQCCGYDPNTEAGRLPCDCHCGSTSTPVPAGNKCTCLTTTVEPQNSCEEGYEDVNGVCAPKQGCKYNRPSCTGCDTCDTSTNPDGVCIPVACKPLDPEGAPAEKCTGLAVLTCWWPGGCTC